MFAMTVYHVGMFTSLTKSGYSQCDSRLSRRHLSHVRAMSETSGKQMSCLCADSPRSSIKQTLYTSKFIYFVLGDSRLQTLYYKDCTERIIYNVQTSYIVAS